VYNTQVVGTAQYIEWLILNDHVQPSLIAGVLPTYLHGRHAAVPSQRIPHPLPPLLHATHTPHLPVRYAIRTQYVPDREGWPYTHPLPVRYVVCVHSALLKGRSVDSHTSLPVKLRWAIRTQCVAYREGCRLYLHDSGKSQRLAVSRASLPSASHTFFCTHTGDIRRVIRSAGNL